MVFLYATDLHGDIQKFNRILEFALTNNIKLIHIGADLLPKGPNLIEAQTLFVKGFLRDFYKRCTKKGIKILAFFGNDDLYSLKDIFREYGELLDDAPYNYKNYNFIAYPFVKDYPFGLKTACKYDYLGCPTEPYISRPVEASPEGFVAIENIDDYFLKKGTIQQDLQHIKGDAKTIAAFHQPPCSLGLDVCRDGRRVGSKSVYEWVNSNHIPLLLCGHIHESPEVSGVWKARVNNTKVIQPGQSWFGSGSTTMVLFYLNKNNIKYFFIK